MSASAPAGTGLAPTGLEPAGRSREDALACADEHCITCGDEATPMTVVRLDAERTLALCEDGEGQRSTVETALVPPLRIGDQVLVHAAVAIAALPAAEAHA
jgi:hydrogenase maturation factor